MTETRYIVIPNWDGKDGFQHYSNRDPIWIKNYRALMTKDEYLELSFHTRGILHGLWLEYAASDRQLRDNTVTLSRRLGGRVTRRDLETLNHAGFIEFAASAPLAPCYQPASPEERREEIEAEEPTPEGSSVSDPKASASAVAREEIDDDDIPRDPPSNGHAEDIRAAITTSLTQAGQGQ